MLINRNNGSLQTCIFHFLLLFAALDYEGLLILFETFDQG